MQQLRAPALHSPTTTKLEEGPAESSIGADLIYSISKWFSLIKCLTCASVWYSHGGLLFILFLLFIG